MVMMKQRRFESSQRSNSKSLSASLFTKSFWTRRVVYGFAAVLAFSLSVLPVQAFPLGELLFRGIQVLQISNISSAQEVQLGAQMHQNLLRRGTRLNPDVALNRYVTGIGQRLVAVNRRRGLPFNFYVVQDPKVNAFATMGGHVYVTTGLMQAADNEAQLASVIAHEIGHIEKRHLIEQIQQSMIARGLVATALGQDQSVLANIGVDLLVSRPQSREDEYQADQVGLRLIKDADYAASAMPEFMRKLVRKGGGSASILSTHPAVPDRIESLRVAIRSGPTNECDTDKPLASCGLDPVAYETKVAGLGRI
jgi:beta-barrel assembly-enhancing protease